MPKTYDKADPGVYKLIASIMKQFHAPLHAASVTVDAVMVTKVNKDGKKENETALKKYGMAAAAIVRVTSLEDRVRGLADVRLLIDQFTWAHCNSNRRQAIIDHELSHIMLKDQEGQPDDIGRPKLSLREHDWVSMGFAQIAERYGNDACEVETLHDAVHQCGQITFPFASKEGKDDGGK